MIPNPILYNDDTIMTVFIVCCLIVLAIIMVPKALRHRRKIRENKNSIPNQQNQDLEMIVIEANQHGIGNKRQLDYKETFMSAPKITDRQTVYVSKEVRDQLCRIARRLGDRKMSVSGFLENMAKHHLEEYKDEINKLYKLYKQ